MPCLHSHAPLDLLVIFLGTNDVGERFASARARRRGIGRPARQARASAEAGPDGAAPAILVVCPPPFDGHHLGPHFAAMCDELGCELLDLDGIASYVAIGDDVEHLDEAARAAVRVGGRGASAACSRDSAAVQLAAADPALRHQREWQAPARRGRAVPTGRCGRRRARRGLAARRAHLGRAPDGARRRTAVPRRHAGRPDDLVCRDHRLGSAPLHVARRRPRRSHRCRDDLDPSRSRPSAATPRRAVSSRSTASRRRDGAPRRTRCCPAPAADAGRLEWRLRTTDVERPPPPREQRRLLGAGRGASGSEAAAAAPGDARVPAAARSRRPRRAAPPRGRAVTNRRRLRCPAAAILGA